MQYKDLNESEYATIQLLQPDIKVFKNNSNDFDK